MHPLIQPIQDHIEKASDEIKKLKSMKNGVDWVLLRVDSNIGFKPEEFGFRLKAVDVKTQIALFVHDKYVLPKSNEKLVMVYMTKDKIFSIATVYAHDKCVSDPDIVGSDLTIGEIVLLKNNKAIKRLYTGGIHHKVQFAKIMEEALKFKLFDGEVVICTTDEDRKRVLDAYLSLDVPKEYKHELIFKDRMQYPIETFPNFRWCYSRQQQKKYWESPCTRKANSYLQAYGNPTNSRPWEVTKILSVDEFIKGLNNHERGD